MNNGGIVVPEHPSVQDMVENPESADVVHDDVKSRLIHSFHQLGAMSEQLLDEIEAKLNTRHRILAGP